MAFADVPWGIEINSNLKEISEKYGIGFNTINPDYRYQSVSIFAIINYLALLCLELLGTGNDEGDEGL